MEGADNVAYICNAPSKSLKEDRQSAVVFSCSCSFLFAFTLSVSLCRFVRLLSRASNPLSRSPSLLSDPPSPDSSPRLCYVIYSFN